MDGGAKPSRGFLLGVSVKPERAGHPIAVHNGMVVAANPRRRDHAAKTARFFQDGGALRVVDGWGIDVPTAK